ncbi:MAG: ATP-dependent Clp protease proteolytic subunit, partial [Planctomycetaceae bacterium]|nr:ATP-dependent Clp protease proteolytic subunit [Planctomycetaceae bacterium]
AGLMNPSETILHLTVDQGDGIKEKRLATAAEAAQLRDQGVVISDSKTLKDQGTPWKISGAEAREEDILITQTAGSTRDVIDAYGLPLEALRNRITGETIDKVAYIELKDTIDDQFYSFAIRQIQRAVNQNVELIIFEIDSPGGGLLHSADIANTIANLREKDIKTVAFVREQAYSGGTIVALGCDEIYMLPEATIGDAIPVLFLEGQALKDTEGKVLSAERELMHQLAERKNRPPALLEAIADIDLEVFEVTHRKTGRVWFMSEAEIHASGEEWLQGALVPETRKGVALTVGGRRAAELRIAEPPVTDLEDLRARLGIPQDIKFRRIERTWVDHVVFKLNGPAMTGLLFFIGVICIYLELHTMTGFFGIISVLAFGVFFWSKIMGGTAGGLEVILFLIGIGCLALEIFVIPGFGVFGISGILLLLVSLVMASQTFGGITAEYDLIQAGRSVAMFGVALFAVMVTGLLLSSFLPKIPFLRGMILDPPGGLAADGPRLRPELAAAAHPLMASRGRSVTVLRPAGKARLDGQIVDVISDGPFIMEDKDIEVVRITGNRIVVREVQA